MKKLVVVFSCCAYTVVSSASLYNSPQMMAYRSFLPELEETARFAEMGIPLRTVFIANSASANGRPYCQYPPVWKGAGDYDFAPVDAQLGDIIKVSPNAEFNVFLDLNTPVWLTRVVRHDSYNEITHALSSPVYMKEASNYLDKLVRYIEEHYGKRVKSYSILCGHTSEWFERDLRQSHVKNGGRKTVHLPRKCVKVVDLLQDRVVATDCIDFNDDFATPDTKIYETVYEK